MVFSPKLGVMLKILSSEYQLYACGKNLSHAFEFERKSSFSKTLCSDDIPALTLS